MIKIIVPNLDNLANQHYEAIANYVKPKKIDMLNKSIKNCFGNSWDFKKLILAKPQELEQLSQIYKWKCCNPLQYFETLYGYFISTKGVFFKDKEKKIPHRAYDLIQSLSMTVCPYCNRNTIYNITNKTKRTSELDHFYPTSKYPFFGVSFYNLIPSCKVCNKIKLAKDDKEYINPYDERFDVNKNMKFSLKFENSDFYHSTNGFQIEYRYNKKISDHEKIRIENNLNDFELKDLYQNHKDIVLELIQKAEIYNDSYIDELMQKYEGTLFKNREDLLRLITCGYVNDEDLHKRPLSKLIKDISEELELL